MKTVYKLLFILSILLINSCCKDSDFVIEADYNKSKEENQPPKPKTLDPFTRNDFPIAVGNHWTYLVSSIYSDKLDTIDVKVVSLEINGDTSLYRTYIYQRPYPEIMDTAYFKVTKNRIEYNSINEIYSYFGTFIINLPFNSGDTWQGLYGFRDSVTVNKFGTVADTIRFFGLKYSPFYSMNRNVNFSDYLFIGSIFVSPRIGVVMQTIKVKNINGLQQQGFYLYEYHLN